EDVLEALVGQGAEEGVAGELRSRGRRAREAAEEACALARGGEGFGMGLGELVEGGAVDGDRRPLQRRHLLRLAGEAERAVAARLGAGFAEVADERLHLAAVVLDEGEDALDALGFRLLAAVEALGETVALLGERRRVLE